LRPEIKHRRSIKVETAINFVKVFLCPVFTQRELSAVVSKDCQVSRTVCVQHRQLDFHTEAHVNGYIF
jgi:hypothetical protein